MRQKGKIVTDKTHVIINGRAYDPITGMPLKDQPSAAQTPTQTRSQQRGSSVEAIHKHHTQRSATLSRRHLARPATKKPVTITPELARVTKHQSVNRFAPAQNVTVTIPTTPRTDRPAEKHPVAHRAAMRTLDINAPRQHRRTNALVKPRQTPVTHNPKPARILKNEAIERALAAEMKPAKHHRTKRQQSRFGRWLSLASAGLAVMLLGGYFTYLSMPNISVKVAAIQSGIDAKYPGYRPDGYALSGPIGFKSGEVSMRFAYAGTDQAYNLTQQKSSWDSSAVKEFVSSKSASQTTTTINGLTIYTYDNNAAWVNGGILYQVDGNAPLSTDQIRRIATSL